MSVLVDRNTRLVVQGITGSAGAFHTRQCIEYGTNVVAGVTPGKGGQIFDPKIPVFDTVWEAKQKTNCNVAMVFVPPALEPQVRAWVATYQEAAAILEQLSALQMEKLQREKAEEKAGRKRSAR